jgi:hypothetical protein
MDLMLMQSWPQSDSGGRSAEGGAITSRVSCHSTANCWSSVRPEPALPTCKPGCDEADGFPSRGQQFGDICNQIMEVAMPSFRNSKDKALHAVGKIAAIGTSRYSRQHDRAIHSLGTRRNYEQVLATCNEWLQAERLGDIVGITRGSAIRYLDHRSGEVRQKSLDMDRQALQTLIGERLPVIRSEIETILTTRSYTTDQIRLVTEALSEKHQLACEIACAAGLRAHELLTIRPVSERPSSSHRKWRQDRFHGRAGAIYTVIGKGGLCREVMVHADLASRLEAQRLPTPKNVVDRGIRYKQHYNITGGRSFSQAVSSASKRALGWSQGAHGLARHSYAQQRMQELLTTTRNGRLIAYNEAKLILSQELGHFRPDIVDVYLR